MGFEVAIYAFASEPRHFNSVTWNDDNSHVTLNSIRSHAPAKCDLDRRFAWLDWGLRQLSSIPLAEWAICGKEIIAPEAQSVQGFPIRWNAPTVCQDISIFLDCIDTTALQAAVDHDRMVASSLYKIESVDKQTLKSAVVEDFQALRWFYSRTSGLGLGALIYKD
jgi:hypothetical protein